MIFGLSDAAAVLLDQYRNIHNPAAHQFGTAEEIIAAIEADSAPPKSGQSLPTPEATPEPASRPRIDAIVAGTGTPPSRTCADTAGTGGTITGLSRRLKQHSPGIVVVGVDPVGSILAMPEQLNIDAGAQYAVEGIGCASQDTTALTA